MSISENEKMLGAHVPNELAERFSAQVEVRGFKIKRAVASAIELWLALPQEYQSHLIDRELPSNSLVELVQEIVDERIDAGRRAGKALLARPKRKQARKDPPA